MFKSPAKNNKATKLALINSLVGNHDLVCCCQNPLLHLHNIILEQLAPELTPQQKQQIKQCLGPDTTGAEEDASGDIGDLDLEKLFADDTGEEETTG